MRSPGTKTDASSPSSGKSSPSSDPASKPKQGLKEMFSGLPGWAWPFIAVCLALPVINLGGAIPGALGFGGAAGCASVAKKAEWEVAPRVLACAGITAGVWVLFFGLAIVIAILRS